MYNTNRLTDKSVGQTIFYFKYEKVRIAHDHPPFHSWQGQGGHLDPSRGLWPLEVYKIKKLKKTKLQKIPLTPSIIIEKKLRFFFTIKTRVTNCQFLE